jgi:hypothetical protein
MADGDDHFTLGVQHGFDDAPVYRWQDPFHQERYDAGYLIGRWSWITQWQRQGTWAEWEVLEARMARKKLVRER